MSAAVVGHRKVVEMTLDSGETVQVTKLSARFLSTVRREVEARIPPIDRADYQVPLPGAMVESDQYMPPEAEAAYTQAVRARVITINNEVTALINACAVNVPRGREQAVAEYADVVREMRQFASLPEDAWSATVNFCILETPRDIQRVSNVSMRELPVEEGEIRDGMYLFRDHLPQRESVGGSGGDAAAGGAVEHTSTPAADEARQLQPQPAL